ncbi:GntR family transcriptional regulator [Roseomonas sp. OT10]|uniref:GntR family transcriptional regulator n=1 Tax=Roseomonas cutis TaxID=2897332 RepID=UPI001E468C3D|nr:GntR family transcriptional regulator [Roseomonas sp. OT10]UFN49356.1 GntR family transcriptional regulator [Roseomonas sp. OT10]
MEEVSVGEVAYRRIRADIVFGRLAPGQRLGLEGMRAAYGAGVSTLRELLSRLSSEGLVTAEGQRGFEVAPVSAAELREIAALRLLLETHALEQSFAAGGLEWESGVVAAHHRLAAMERLLLAGEASEAERWKRYDWEFHHALVAACGSQVLLQAHAAIYDRYLRYQMVAAVFRGAVAAEEHRRLLDAALARDVAAARSLLADHIHGCVAQVLETGALDAFRSRPPVAAAGRAAARRRRPGAEPAPGRGTAKRRERGGKAAG